MAAKTTGFLAKTGSLKRLLEERLVATDTKDPISSTDLVSGASKRYIRASGFADMCPREEVLRILSNEGSKAEKLNADSNLIFATGTAYHWAFQNLVFPKLGDVLYGQWKCNCCSQLHGGTGHPDFNPNNITDSLVLRPEKCDVCHGREFTYDEIQLGNAEYCIGGHPDGFIRLPDRQGMGIVEFKTVGASMAWQIHHSPIMSHVIQVHIYMWLTNTQWATILYIEKAQNGLNALIEHYIERDEDTIETIKTELRRIWDSLDGKAPLPDRICENAECPRASKCSMVKKCFDPSTSAP